MFFEILENKKFVCYWFTTEDLENKTLRESLISEQKEWNKKGYRVCEFHSGTGNLFEHTKELLIHNKEVLSKNENLKKVVL